MKKVLIIAAITMLIMLAIGCQTSRIPVTKETFVSKAEEAGYDVQDAIEQVPANTIDEYLIAVKGGTVIDYQIEFIIAPTAQTAQILYQNNKSTIEEKKGPVSTEASTTAGNFSYYKLATNGQYYVVSRIENTLVYIDAPSEYKGAINEFLAAIGY